MLKLLKIYMLKLLTKRQIPLMNHFLSTSPICMITFHFYIHRVSVNIFTLCRTNTQFQFNYFQTRLKNIKRYKMRFLYCLNFINQACPLSHPIQSFICKFLFLVLELNKRPFYPFWSFP